jgi:hypothetical protein
LLISPIWEVVPLRDEQVRSFANGWPLGYPTGKSPDGFWADLTASPKILEVSRSPLLLVGSLLLYTESNLGIPGERVKFLEKIKNTLVEDWGTAQGHPPDPRRIAYTPVLANIALRMHERQIAELPRSECIHYIQELLPEYGFEPNDAEAFLESLLTRTGILVRDVPGEIIFVQFTLQEFFASLNLATKYTPEAIAKLHPESWWREAILFAIGRAQNPTPFVTALFDTSPMMGAMAVAESPTPSLELQEKAVAMVIKQLDAQDETATLPIVTLLRKVSGKVERELCEGIGRRLENENERVSAIAGRALATAGTAAATATLSEYPVAWKHCLDTAGYLSGTFEKLLFNWVETPGHTHWQDAATLLTSRFEHIAQLIIVLEKLSGEKAEFLASLIVERMYGTQPGRRPVPARMLCTVIPYLKNKDILRRRMLTNTPSSERGSMTILTALVLGKSTEHAKPAAQTETLVKLLEQAQAWSRQRAVYFVLIASAFPATLVLELGSILSAMIMTISAFVAVNYVGKRSMRFIWENSRAASSITMENLAMLLAGIAMTLAATQPSIKLTLAPSFYGAYVLAFMLSLEQIPVDFTRSLRA